jgi:hypothetical protein
MQTIRSDPRGHQVKVLVLFDGTMDEFLQDFIATYYANADLKLGVQFVQGGSNGATFLIALDMLRKSDAKQLAKTLSRDLVVAVATLNAKHRVELTANLLRASLEDTLVRLGDHAVAGRESDPSDEQSELWQQASGACRRKGVPALQKLGSDAVALFAGGHGNQERAGVRPGRRGQGIGD